MKKEIKEQFRKDTQGSVLSFVAVMVLVLSIAGMALLRLGLNARMQAHRATSGMSARSAADAGLIQAVHSLNEKLQTLEEWDITTLATPSEVYLPNCHGTYQYKLIGDSDSGYQIVSVGRSNQIERTVYASLKLKGLFDYAIFVLDNLELKVGTTVDWYNFDADDEPLQIVTNSTETGALNMRTGVTVEGDVVVGPEADPDLVINSRLEADITGDVYALAESVVLPIITVPDSLLLSPSKGSITGSETIVADGKYDTISIANNDIALIDGDITLYITGDIVLDTFAQLQINEANPDSSLTIYLGGNFQEKNGGIINNTTMDAKKLSIYGLETCATFDFLVDCTFCGTIYAPYAAVMLNNKVIVYGAIVSDSFVQNVGADFFYDASLRDVSIDDIGVTFEIGRWKEE